MRYEDHPIVRFFRVTAPTVNGADVDIPADAGAIIGICTVGTDARLFYEVGATDCVVAAVVAAVIPNHYFPTPLPVEAGDPTTPRRLHCSGNGAVNPDFTVLYIPKKSSE